MARNVPCRNNRLDKHINEIMQDMFREDGYLNDFHKAWNEKCIKDDKEHWASMQAKGMCYTAEFLRAQSQRMDALVRQEEEMLRGKRKKRPKDGR